MNQADTNEDIHEAETLPPPPMPKAPGWVNITPERHREISSMGGRAAQATGRCHRWTRDEAAAAGRKGAAALRAKRERGQ